MSDLVPYGHNSRAEHKYKLYRRAPFNKTLGPYNQTEIRSIYKEDKSLRMPIIIT